MSVGYRLCVLSISVWTSLLDQSRLEVHSAPPVGCDPEPATADRNAHTTVVSVAIFLICFL